MFIRRVAWITVALIALVSGTVVSIGESTVAEMQDPESSPIPILSEWTPTTQVFNNSDGTLTANIFADEAQMPDPASETGWSPVDTKLTSVPDGWTPELAHAGIVLSSGGVGSMASVELGAAKLAVEWEGELPPPTISGDTAVYGEVMAGVDATVQALPSGFEVNFVVDSPAHAPQAVEIPLSLEGLHASLTEEGELVLTNNAGYVVGGADPARMWGAAIDEATGEPAVQALVPTSLVGGPDDIALVLTPDPSFFTDPGVTYPVTIDPAISLSIQSATYVDSSNPDTAYTTSTQLRSGLWTGGPKYRSFIDFDAEPLAGKHVLSASLQLYETWSYSCTPSQVDLYSVLHPIPSPLTWNSQPTENALYASVSAAKGYSASCPAGTITLQGGGAGGTTLTDLVQLWADGNETPATVEVRAHDETDVNGGKTFTSSNTANPPVLSVTYNTLPNAPTNLFTSSGGPGQTILHGTYSDPDGGVLQGYVKYFLYDSTGSLIASGNGTTVGSGNDSPYTVSTSLFQQAKIWKARSHDGTDYSPYSVTGNSCVIPEGPPPGADMTETEAGHRAYLNWLATDGAQAAGEAIGNEIDTQFGEPAKGGYAGPLSAGYVGTAIDHAAQTVRVVVDIQLVDEQTLDANLQQVTAAALQGQTGFSVAVVASCFSSSTLMGALAVLVGRSWTAGAGDASFSVTLSAHDSVFHVSFQRHAIAIAEALEASVGGLASIDFDGASRAARFADGTPHWGGAGIYRPGYKPLCSSGFAVRKANGNKASITAGHCWNNGAEIRSGGSFYGNVEGKSGYPTWDMELIAGSTYENRIYTDPPTGHNRYVKSKGPTQVTNLICVSGAKTLAKCGLVVTSVNAFFCDNDGDCTYGLIRASRDGDRIVQTGDSGGPMYSRPNSTDAKIRGMIIAGNVPGTVVYGEKIVNIESHLNVTVVVTS